MNVIIRRMSFYSFPVRARKINQYTARLHQMVALTFHAHRNSSCFGGTTDARGSDTEGSVVRSSKLFSASFSSCSVEARNSNGLGSSPNRWTAGIPFRKDRNLSVKRGPISWSATFSVDLNAYLTTPRKDGEKTIRRARDLPMPSEK